jgi:hypothetical protein
MTDPDILVTGQTLIDFLRREADSLAAETFDRRAGGL